MRQVCRWPARDHIVPIQRSYSSHTVLIWYSYSSHTVLIQFEYSVHTVLMKFSYSAHTGIIQYFDLFVVFVYSVWANSDLAGTLLYSKALE